MRGTGGGVYGICGTAKLLYLDQVPQVHVPGADVRAWRGLIELRRKLVDAARAGSRLTTACS